MMKIVPTASDLRLPVNINTMRSFYTRILIADLPISEGLGVLSVPCLYPCNIGLSPPPSAGKLGQVSGQLEAR